MTTLISSIAIRALQALLEYQRVIRALRDGLIESAAATADERLRSLEQAAVLILLREVRGEVEVVLSRRAAHMRLHPGEIAFPGGRRDHSDEDEWHTALREAEEEIGLHRNQAERLGQLEVLVTRSDIAVTPCVAGLGNIEVEFSANPQELDEVFSAPLRHFSDPDQLTIEHIETSDGVRQVPHYRYRHYDIWGVTAFMLVRLVNIGYNAGFQLKR